MSAKSSNALISINQVIYDLSRNKSEYSDKELERLKRSLISAVRSCDKGISKKYQPSPYSMP